MAIVNLSGNDVLVFGEAIVRTGDVRITGSETLLFHEAVVRAGSFYASGSEVLAFAEVGPLTRSPSGHDTLTFLEKATRIFELSGSDAISFTDATGLPPKAGRDALALIEAKSVDKSSGGSDTFIHYDPTIFALIHGVSFDSMREAYSLAVVRKLAGSDALILRDGGFCVAPKLSVCSEAYIVLGTRTNFVLTYPYAAPTTTLTLKVPLFGNTDQTETGTKVRRTLGNQLSVARGNWPTIRKFRFDFSALQEQQRDDFLAFALLALGKEIGLLDQEDRQWRGFIISAAPTTQVGRGCDYSAGFEFQGVLA